MSGRPSERSHTLRTRRGGLHGVLNDEARQRTLPSSFRDPAGIVFSSGGIVYRQRNTIYRTSYDRLMESGLYRVLTDSGLLIPHTEVRAPVDDGLRSAYRILRP